MRGTVTALVLTAGLGMGCGSGGGGAPAAPSDPAAEVRRVNDRLNRVTFPKDRDEAKLRAVVSEINSIDISRCPEDYRAAYARQADAVGALVDYMIETGSWEHRVSTGVESFLRGFTGTDPFGGVREARERHRQLQTRITEATGHYQRTLAKYTN
jgi:hypothetical protein